MEKLFLIFAMGFLFSCSKNSEVRNNTIDSMSVDSASMDTMPSRNMDSAAAANNNTALPGDTMKNHRDTTRIRR